MKFIKLEGKDSQSVVNTLIKNARMLQQELYKSLKVFERPILEPDLVVMDRSVASTPSVSEAARRPMPAAPAQPPLLQVRGLSAGYGASRVLHGLELEIFPRETLVVVGRNGVGKTTLVESIMGLTTHHAGEIVWEGQPIQGMPPQASRQSEYLPLAS